MAEFPAELEAAITEGAKRLGRALEILGYPNGGKHAPCHEINAVINIATCLGRRDPPYHLYAEGTTPNRGRIDLMGFNGAVAFGLEAKGFGKINERSTSILSDIDRMRAFRPTLSELKNQPEALQWWDAAATRWGIVVISSFRGHEVARAWEAEDEAQVLALMGSYSTFSDRPAFDAQGEPVGFVKLHRAIRGCRRGAVEFTDGKLWDGGAGYLLWAAFPLGA